MKLLFLPGTTSGPAARFRIHQFLPYLRRIGHAVEVHVISPERSVTFPTHNSRVSRVQAWGMTIQRIASLRDVFLRSGEYDVIMMNRDLIPEKRVTFLEPLLAARNSHLIFDFDDAIQLTRDAKMRKILPSFAVITPGNDYLANYARSLHHDVRVWPTVVDTAYYYASTERPSQLPVRIGWSGSTSSLKVDLPTIEPVITRLSQLCEFEFVVIANSDPEIKWSGVNYRFVQWAADMEVEGLHQIDIGLMPLDDGPFQRGKCSLKAIQYMANGIPAVVSPVGANITTVIHGETGFHAATEEEWIGYLRELISNAQLRKRMGASARDHVVANYSIESLLPKMLSTFEQVSRM